MQPILPSQYGERLHHTGFVVASIDAVIEGFCKAVCGSNWSETWYDPVQRVRVAFIYPSQPGDASVELVEPEGHNSPVEKFLERGGGLHHLCYEVDNLDQVVRTASARGVVLVRHPKPAVAFDGRRIAWVLTKENLLIEYLERAC
jgi:methylmalonyl-CoA/ethylmalonyl-CoA epimerase